MSSINQPEQRTENERQVLEWVGQIYGSEVQKECSRILEEQMGTRELCAEVLEEALFRLNLQDFDDAVLLGEQCFSSD